MEILIRDVNDVKIVDLNGNLDTITAPDVEKVFNKTIDNGAKNILINFQRLEYISSAGLRILLTLAKKMMGIGGKLKLCSLNETAQEVFDMSGFSTIFKIHSSEKEAISDY